MKIRIKNRIFKYNVRLFLLVNAFGTLINSSAIAQCPVNIDFEQGDFNGWQCWTGNHKLNEDGSDTINFGAATLTPVPGRHSLFTTIAANGVDSFGLFPINCPNGSGNSIRLGNATGNHEAEGVSYTFTIPAAQNEFHLIYHYAVVFQNPGHLLSEQPAFKVKVENLTDGTTIDCPSLNLIAKDNLPGFFLSARNNTGTDVWCKNWSANAVNLKNLAGKTIRIFFTTADCTYTDHFGYAYIDIDKRCDNSFNGNVFCANDTAVNLTAPSGFQNYTWYNNNFSQVLGTQQTLRISPLPATGTVITVELIPKDGYGCRDTLSAQLFDTLIVKANAGPDLSSCNSVAVQLGVDSLQGLIYKWSPATGLDNPDISNPFAKPAVLTQYVLTVSSKEGGCTDTDAVTVNAKTVNDFVNLNGPANYCIGTGPFPLLSVSPADSIQWFKDGIAISGAAQTQYTVTQTGKYFAQLFSNTCPLPINTKEKIVTVDTALQGITYPVKYVPFYFPLKLQARQLGTDFLWSPPASLDDRNSPAPVFRGINAQLYTVRIKNPSGCFTVDTQLVKTHKKIDIFVPTAFTPGGDGKNDYLRPVMMGIIKVNYFRIYSRWGKLLFEMKSDLPGWDGKINNQPQEIQTVVWVIEAIDVDGKVHNQRGTTVLYR